MIPSQYLPKQSRSSYVQYMRIGCLIRNIFDVLRQLGSLCKGWEERKEQEISQLESEGFESTSGGFVVLLIEVANF